MSTAVATYPRSTASVPPQATHVSRAAAASDQQQHRVRFAPLPSSTAASSSVPPHAAPIPRRTSVNSSAAIPAVTQVVRESSTIASMAASAVPVGQHHQRPSSSSSSARRQSVHPVAPPVEQHPPVVFPPPPLAPASTSTSTNADHRVDTLANYTRNLESNVESLSSYTRHLESTSVQAIKYLHQIIETNRQTAKEEFKTVIKEELVPVKDEVAALREENAFLRTEFLDFKQAARDEFQRRSLEVEEIKTNPFLQVCVEYLCTYGMDTRFGFIAAFPMFFPLRGSNAASSSTTPPPDELFVVISVPLLSAGIKKLFPGVYSLHKLTTQQILLNMQKLHPVTSKIDADMLMTRTRSIFPVRQYANATVEGAWIVFPASEFIGFHRQTSQLNALLPVLTKDVAVFQNQYARKHSGASDQESKRSKVMWCREAAHNRAMTSKMAWACEVQGEVLAQPAVGEFFRRVKRMLGQPFVGQRAGPFHFRGLTPLFDAPVMSHDMLVTRRVSALGGGAHGNGGAAAGSDASSTDESDPASSMSEAPKSRKRKASSAPASSSSAAPFPASGGASAASVPNASTGASQKKARAAPRTN